MVNKNNFYEQNIKTGLTKPHSKSKKYFSLDFLVLKLP